MQKVQRKIIIALRKNIKDSFWKLSTKRSMKNLNSSKDFKKVRSSTCKIIIGYLKCLYSANCIQTDYQTPIIEKSWKFSPKKSWKLDKIVRALANRLNLKDCIQKIEQRKKKVRLSYYNEVDCLLEFFNRAYISYMTPGRKDHVFLYWEKEWYRETQTKWIFTYDTSWTLWYYKRSRRNRKREDSFLQKLGEKLKFRQMCDLLKLQKENIVAPL